MKGDYEWAPGYGISCQNNKNRLHRLQEHSLLIKCIDNAVMNLEASIPLYPQKKSSMFSHPIITTNQNLLSMKIPVKQVVLFTNFMSQHSVWTMTLPEIEEALHKQAKDHKVLAEKFAAQKNVQYRRIFFASTMVHGFRTGKIFHDLIFLYSFIHIFYEMVLLLFDRWIDARETEVVQCKGRRDSRCIWLGNL